MYKPREIVSVVGLGRCVVVKTVGDFVHVLHNGKAHKVHISRVIW